MANTNNDSVKTLDITSYLEIFDDEALDIKLSDLTQAADSLQVDIMRIKQEKAWIDTQIELLGSELDRREGRALGLEFMASEGYSLEEALDDDLGDNETEDSSRVGAVK